MIGVEAIAVIHRISQVPPRVSVRLRDERQRRFLGPATSTRNPSRVTISWRRTARSCLRMAGEDGRQWVLAEWALICAGSRGGSPDQVYSS